MTSITSLRLNSNYLLGGDLEGNYKPRFRAGFVQGVDFVLSSSTAICRKWYRIFIYLDSRWNWIRWICSVLS